MNDISPARWLIENDSILEEILINFLKKLTYLEHFSAPDIVGLGEKAESNLLT